MCVCHVHCISFTLDVFSLALFKVKVSNYISYRAQPNYVQDFVLDSNFLKTLHGYR